MNHTVSRKDFLSSLIRYFLFLILAIISVFLGTRAVHANDCSTCPGFGICKGDTDCNNFLNGSNGEK